LDLLTFSSQVSLPFRLLGPWRSELGQGYLSPKFEQSVIGGADLWQGQLQTYGPVNANPVFYPVRLTIPARNPLQSPPPHFISEVFLRLWTYVNLLQLFAFGLPSQYLLIKYSRETPRFSHSPCPHARRDIALDGRTVHQSLACASTAKLKFGTKSNRLQFKHKGCYIGSFNQTAAILVGIRAKYIVSGSSYGAIASSEPVLESYAGGGFSVVTCVSFFRADNLSRLPSHHCSRRMS
jgi:hypothetical protein